jgi:hypothetical protein
MSVTDDHIPLLDAGLRMINVIDIDYPAHHTPRDTFDTVSRESMQIVGNVARELIRRVGSERGARAVRRALRERVG